MRKSHVPYTDAKLLVTPVDGLFPKRAVNHDSQDARPCTHGPDDLRLGGEYFPALGIDQIHVADDEVAAAV